MTRQALIAEAAGVNLVGEYEQRGTGLAPGGKPARFGCGRTDRVEKEWPVFWNIGRILSRPPKMLSHGEREIQKEEEVGMG